MHIAAAEGRGEVRGDGKESLLRTGGVDGKGQSHARGGRARKLCRSKQRTPGVPAYVQA